MGIFQTKQQQYKNLLSKNKYDIVHLKYVFGVHELNFDSYHAIYDISYGNNKLINVDYLTNNTILYLFESIKHKHNISIYISNIYKSMIGTINGAYIDKLKMLSFHDFKILNFVNCEINYLSIYNEKRNDNIRISSNILALDDDNFINNLLKTNTINIVTKNVSIEQLKIYNNKNIYNKEFDRVYKIMFNDEIDISLLNFIQNCTILVYNQTKINLEYISNIKQLNKIKIILSDSRDILIHNIEQLNILIKLFENMEIIIKFPS